VSDSIEEVRDSCEWAFSVKLRGVSEARERRFFLITGAGSKSLAED